MKSYLVLESCHYQGVTYRKGQTVSLPQDPQWPERFQAIGGAASPEPEHEKHETKTGAAKAPARK